VVASDVVIGAPGGGRESGSGDGAVAFVTGPDSEAIARIVGRASATAEILDVWRLASDPFAKQWEERFGAETLGPVVLDTATRALKSAGVGPADLKTVILDGTNARAMAFVPEALRWPPSSLPIRCRRGRTAPRMRACARACLDSANAGDRSWSWSAASLRRGRSRDGEDRPRARSTGRPVVGARNDLPYKHLMARHPPFAPPGARAGRPAAPPMQRAGQLEALFRCARGSLWHRAPCRRSVCVSARRSTRCAGASPTPVQGRDLHARPPGATGATFREQRAAQARSATHRLRS
jgi:hypothetical protein